MFYTPRGNRLFLLTGMALVCVLTLCKIQIARIQPPEESTLLGNHPFNRQIAPPPLPHSVLIVEGHRFAITKAMVTNEQYRIFSETTGYKTLREREGIAQNWQYPNGSETPPSWREHPDRPVTWLARRDAEAYLCWLSLCHEQKVKFRLPSVQELAAALEEPEFWLWSHEDMGSLPSQRANAAEYLTSWRGNSPLRYRREEESLRSDHEATSFVIAWTLY